ncbi:hypothetical protein CALCODRAFT_265100 [Calocera cornea HHB12733]|uniref:Uncharacterized protein n=1 Tax=Calocera cornea HHB12733 TaxID=1353952 RepID=A0A165GDH1_9BASI|nr:hypothetical protein CALCODRAFT_265100 [Calocera cornea HHB12733]
MDSHSTPLPEPGSPQFFASLYAHVSDATDVPVDKHVFTCLLFCLIARAHLPSGNHLLLRSQREELSHLREMVVSILSDIFGLMTLHLRCRSDTSPDSLLSDLLSYSVSEGDGAGGPSNHSRKSSTGNSRASSGTGRRQPGPLSHPGTGNFRSHSSSLRSRGGGPFGPLPQALVVTSLGRSTHDTQECLWNVLRARSCVYNGTVHHLPDDLLVVVLNDIGDGRERPHVIPCLLDQFSFSSYVSIPNSFAQPQSTPSAPSSPVIPMHYLHRLKQHPLPSLDPFLANYMSNLLTAATQHPLLQTLLVGNRARAAFKHFTAVSTIMFCNEDGRRQTQHPTQEDIARVYVHVLGHRVSIRNVGEGVLSILDRTLVALPHDKSQVWRPGMKRGETVPQIMRDILVGV